MKMFFNVVDLKKINNKKIKQVKLDYNDYWKYQDILNSTNKRIYKIHTSLKTFFPIPENTFIWITDEFIRFIVLYECKINKGFYKVEYIYLYDLIHSVDLRKVQDIEIIYNSEVMEVSPPPITHALFFLFLGPFGLLLSSKSSSKSFNIPYIKISLKNDKEIIFNIVEIKKEKENFLFKSLVGSLIKKINNGTNLIYSAIKEKIQILKSKQNAETLK